MLRTTTSRAVTTGVGALAATTALVLAAPSALAASGEYVLDPGQDVLFTAFGFPADEEQAEALDATPVDLAVDGTVTVRLPARAVAATAPTVTLVDADEYYETLDTEVIPEPIALDQPLEPTLDADGLLSVVLPTDDETVDDQALDGVDDVVLVVSGLTVAGFPGSPLAVAVPLDLRPEDDAADLVVVPAAVDASFVDATALLPTPFTAVAGETFEIVLPGASSLRELGVTSLDDIDGFLVPLDEEGGEDGVDLVLDSIFGSSSVEAGDAGLDLLAEASPSPAELEPALEASVAEGGTTLLEVEELVEEDRATVKPSEDLEAGSYLMVFSLFSEDEDVVAVSTLGELELAAAVVEPVPTPTVTVTQPAPAPAPAATVTAPAPRQNPGLRSNTGVEARTVPGLSDGQLLGLGGGLFGLGVVAGAAVLRSQRRARA